MSNLIQGLMLVGWTREQAERYLAQYPRIWFSVAGLPLVEAVNALEVYAAYEGVN